MTDTFVWTKLGKVFDPADFPGRPWMSSFAQAPATLIRDEYVRVYFSTRPLPDSQGQFTSYSAWLDLDRADITKVLRVAENPILDLGETGTFDEFGTYPFSAIETDQGILGYYAGWTRCESVPFDVAIGAARSTDGGKSFEKLGAGPIIGSSMDEPFILSGPKIRCFAGTYYLFYIAGTKWVKHEGRAEPVYRIRMARSDDGVNWRKHNRHLIETAVEVDEAQASPDVHYHNGRYHMFFCYRYATGYRGHARGYRIGYACSDDLSTWHRDDARAGLHPSEEGWDSEMVSYPHVFTVDGTTYMAYLGNGVGREGFGIAKLEARP
ncbi:glycosylase [Ruegeria arenilitoris]|uniref:glycosylase n=1 Tax=Ruegeria arenilitoris TaxID=1173585 RepID=UPI00147CE7C4|nr:glycosylase [Ruegeria arenilitoris]